MTVTESVHSTVHGLQYSFCTTTTSSTVCVFIHRFDIGAHDLDALKRLLAFSSRYVQTLTLDQLPSHLNLEIIFDGLGKCAPLSPLLL